MKYKLMNDDLVKAIILKYKKEFEIDDLIVANFMNAYFSEGKIQHESIMTNISKKPIEEILRHCEYNLLAASILSAYSGHLIKIIEHLNN